MKTRSNKPLMQGVTVRIEKSTYDKLTKYCKENKKMKTRIVKEAIEKYLKENE